jgi:uncharacterized protein YtpQ (UPF0354 family)
MTPSNDDLSKKYSLESLLNDPTFEKEQPALFRAFLEELKEREPELHQKHYGNRQHSDTQEKETNILDTIFPIIKPGQQPTTAFQDQHGVTHELPVSAQIIIYPIFDGLGVVFGNDKGSHYEWLQNKHVAPSLNTNDIINRAYANLMKQISSTMSINILREGLGMLTNCSRLESSLVLVPQVWDAIFNALKTNDVLFSIPTQDVLFFCDVNHAENVKVFKEKTAEIFENPLYPKKLSSTIYRKAGTNDITVYTT